MNHASANRLRVECDENGVIWLLGPGLQRRLDLEQLAGLARLLCRSRNRRAGAMQQRCVPGMFEEAPHAR